MEVKKTLEQLIEKDGLDNISLNQDGFTVYFGDILNTETSTGNQYYLLDSYVYFPYTLIDSQVKLHRGIVNEFETGGPDYQYEYSGFVHYGGHGHSFCWGACGVDSILKSARLEQEFTEDTYYSLILHFQKYLETSSHDSGARTTAYKKLDLPTGRIEFKNIPVSVKYIDNIPYIFEYAEIKKIEGKMSVDYSKPYKRVIKEFPNRAFVYKDQTIIPKVVEHYMIGKTEVEITPKFSNASDFLFELNKQELNLIHDEITNKKRITLENCIHQLTNSQHRVDGGIRI